MTGSRLAADSLVRRYGGREALRGVSVTAEPGELLGLLGPNGAGKTTLLTLLAGLSSPDGGCVRLDGELLTPRAQRLRARVGLATQDLAIYPELSAAENLHFFGRLYGLRGADLNARVDELLAAVELSGRATDRAGEFSGGMKRRLNLAAAIVHRPTILLLDEPTTGVDPQSRNHLFEQVRRLNREGLTVIYTSHYMEEVQALCPRVAILDHGRIIASDRVSALLRRLPTRLELDIGGRDDVGAEVAAVPGVAAAGARPGGVWAEVADPAPVLPVLFQLCAARGVAGDRRARRVAEPGAAVFESDGDGAAGLVGGCSDIPLRSTPARETSPPGPLSEAERGEPRASSLT